MTKLERETMIEALNLLHETNEAMSEKHGDEYPSNNELIENCLMLLDNIKNVTRSNDEIKKEFCNTNIHSVTFDVTAKMIRQVLFSETNYSALYLQTRGYSELCNLMWYYVGRPENIQVIE